MKHLIVSKTLIGIKDYGGYFAEAHTFVEDPRGYIQESTKDLAELSFQLRDSISEIKRMMLLDLKFNHQN